MKVSAVWVIIDFSIYLTFVIMLSTFIDPRKELFCIIGFVFFLLLITLTINKLQIKEKK